MSVLAERRRVGVACLEGLRRLLAISGLLLVSLGDLGAFALAQQRQQLGLELLARRLLSEVGARLASEQHLATQRHEVLVVADDLQEHELVLHVRRLVRLRTADKSSNAHE